MPGNEENKVVAMVTAANGVVIPAFSDPRLLLSAVSA